MKATRVLLALAALSCSSSFAANPPELINYQGVLRDAADDALDGAFDMRYRFYDDAGGAPPCPASGGTLLLTDEHLAAGSGAVNVTGGLFNVALGSGSLVPGTAATVGELFRQNVVVWLEVEVAGEVLCPRTRVVASPYAMNSLSLDGVLGGGFLRSDVADTFTGSALTLSTGAEPDLKIDEDSLRVNSDVNEVLLVWNDGAGLMNLQLDGDLYVGGGSSTDIDRIRFDDFFGNELIAWDDLLSKFVVSDDLEIAGAFRTGNATGGGTTQPYNVMRVGSGNPLPGSGLMADAGDLLVSGDVEIDGIAVLAGELRLLDTGGDQTQTIWFYNGGSSRGEFFSWVETSERFELSDDMWVGGSLISAGLDLQLGSEAVVEVDSTSVNDVFIRRDQNSNDASWFRVFDDSSSFEQMRIQDGDEAATLFDGTVTSNGLDYAEAFRVPDDSPIDAGDVVGLDPSRPEFIVRASTRGISTAIGVVSANPGYLTGMSFAAEDQADPELCAARDAARDQGDFDTARAMTVELTRKVRASHRAVALVGRVPVKVVATNGPIAAGDRLTTSDVLGHAMKMTEPGPSIGIAIESWDGDGAGRVLTFIQPGWYGGTAASVGAAPGALDGEAESTLLVDPLAGGVTTGAASGVVTGIALGVAPGVAGPGLDSIGASRPAHEIVLGRAADGRSRFSVVGNGTSGEERDELFRVNERGDVFAKGAFRPAAMDVAEYFPLSETAEPGDVLAIDLDSPGRYRPAGEAADSKVIGIVSRSAGVLLGSDIPRIMAADPALAARVEQARTFGDGEEEARLWQRLEQRFLETHAAVALTGTVPVKVDAGYGAIRPGDLLTSSPTAGHAMRADEPLPGTILGKALEGLANGTGRVRALVILR